MSTTFIYALLNSGDLSGFKLGSKLWRIKPEAVAEYEQRQAERKAAQDHSPTFTRVGKEARDGEFRLARLGLQRSRR